MASWEQLVEAGRELGPDPSLAEVDNDLLIASLSTQAATVTRETARWVVLLAEAVVRGVWCDQGATSPGQWLSWKVGMAPSTARDHVRVGLALRTLPKIRAAFLAGQVSYSKVRAMTRLGHEETEQVLLDWADAAPAAELERIITFTRRSCRVDGINPDPLVADPTDATNPSARVERYDVRHREGDAAEVVFTLDEADAARLDVRLRWLARQHDPDLPFAVQVSLALQEAVRAATVAGPIDDSGDDRDRLVVAVQASLVRGGDDRSEDGRGVDNRGEDVRGGVRDSAESPDRRLRLIPRLRAGSGPAMSVRTLRRLACEADVVLLVEDHDGRPLDVGRTQRHATAKQRRALRLRDPGCRFPGCGATRRLHVHHANEWDADDGPTDLDNPIHLCGFHHRFIHTNDWKVAPTGAGRFAFLDATSTPFTAAPARPEHPARPERPDRPVPGDSAESPPLPRLHAAPDAQNTDPAPDRTLEPRHWSGDPIDLDLCVAVLRQELDRRTWRGPDTRAA